MSAQTNPDLAEMYAIAYLGVQGRTAFGRMFLVLVGMLVLEPRGEMLASRLGQGPKVE